MDKSSAPSLLPVVRSQQQAKLRALILGDPTAEHWTDLEGGRRCPATRYFHATMRPISALMRV